MAKIIISGKLIYDDNAEYQLISPTGTVNISTFLDKVYNSNNQYIKIKIMNCCKLIFEEQGKLLKKLDQFGINCYHINSCNVDYTLFQEVDNDIEITIFAETIRQGDRYSYEQQEQIRNKAAS